jgi:hypothetical protein
MDSVGFKRETEGCAGPWGRGTAGGDNVSEVCEAAAKGGSDAIN